MGSRRNGPVGYRRGLSAVRDAPSRDGNERKGVGRGRVGDGPGRDGGTGGEGVGRAESGRAEPGRGTGREAWDGPRRGTGRGGKGELRRAELRRDSMFETVLVANRGDIAVRIMRTLRGLGVRWVAVFSDADEGARHVREADTAVRLGSAAAVDSYLSIERILDAAAQTG